MDYSGGRLEAERSVRNLDSYTREIKSLDKNIEKRRWGREGKVGCKRRKTTSHRT